MKFLPPNPHRRSGFTLIELMVGLGIAMLLIGAGLGAGKFWQANQALHKPMDEIKGMAKLANHRAIAEQRDWEIVLRADSLELRPKKAASDADQKFLDTADEKLKRKDGVQSVGLGEGVLLSVKRFGEDQWHKPNPDYWVFQHSGICEPIQIRVEVGDRAIEAQFDPLTAGVQFEEEFP